MQQGLQKRVLIPAGHWTPFRNEIFENWLGGLRQKNAAALYALMYDRAYQRSLPIVKATLKDLSQRSGLKPDDVEACIGSLTNERLIRLKAGSIHHSGRKLQWEVPLANVDLKAGNWTPIPRFLIREYIPAYPNAVLLLLLLHYQQRSWTNSCWPGVPRLSRQLGWSTHRVSRVLTAISTPDEWKKLGTHLPTPLASSSEFDPAYGRNITHYRVRAVRYERIAEQLPTVRLRAFALKRFNIPSPATA